MIARSTIGGYKNLTENKTILVTLYAEICMSCRRLFQVSCKFSLFRLVHILKNVSILRTSQVQIVENFELIMLNSIKKTIWLVTLQYPQDSY